MELPRLAWPVLGLGCLIVACVFAAFWPQAQGAGASGLPYLVLRWGHMLVWLLLAISFFVRAGNSRSANMLALAALLVYLAFLAVRLRG
jgi:hypothetical protein